MSIRVRHHVIVRKQQRSFAPFAATPTVMLSALRLARRSCSLAGSSLSARTPRLRWESTAHSAKASEVTSQEPIEEDQSSNESAETSDAKTIAPKITRRKATEEDWETFKKYGFNVKTRRTKAEKESGVLTPYEAFIKIAQIKRGATLHDVALPKRARRSRPLLFTSIPDKWDEDPNDPMTKFPPTPPLDEWVELFPSKVVAIRDRVQVSNPKTAMAIAKAFMEGESNRSDQPKVVIEAFPGPGQLSRALLTYPPDKLKKLIILETYGPFLECLKPLERVDPRVKVIPRSGYTWDTYTHLMQSGELDDVEELPWNAGIHPTLRFISHVSMHTSGDQLVSQLFRCIPERAWLFKYGRIPLGLLMNDFFWHRLSGAEGSQERCKAGVLAQAASATELAMPFEALQPFVTHFYPAKGFTVVNDRKRDARRVGSPFVALSAVPLEEQIIKPGELSNWDYVLRKLFIHRATPLQNAIGYIAPGAQHLLSYINENLPAEQLVDYSKEVRQLSVREWEHIVRAFDEWPFKPEDLAIDSYMHYDEAA